jgi:hypothetical protein
MENNLPKIKLHKGIRSDNGATPWYAFLYIGSEKQRMKMAFDSGTDHSWMTSNRCTTAACLMHQRFDIYLSETYKQISSMYEPLEISFGPWGSMFVSMGQDDLFIEDKQGTYIPVLSYQFYISNEYKGEQFQDLVWDGAIGIPSLPNQNDTSELVKILLNRPHIKEKTLYFNYKDKVLHFGISQEKLIPKLSLVRHEKSTMNNLWFLRLSELNVNGQKLIVTRKNKIIETKEKSIDFCIDTGSSHFKGDPAIINALIDAVTYGNRLPLYVTKTNPDFLAYPVLTIVLEEQSFIIEPKNYFEKIAEDLYVLAFHPMEGLDNILLAGSDFLEKFNPVLYFDENMFGTHISLLEKY